MSHGTGDFFSWFGEMSGAILVIAALKFATSRISGAVVAVGATGAAVAALAGTENIVRTKYVFTPRTALSAFAHNT